MASRQFMAGASCKGLDPNIFYPASGYDEEVAKAVCSGCWVQKDCLEYALETGEQFGVWGSTTEKDRRRILKRYRRQNISSPEGATAVNIPEWPKGKAAPLATQRGFRVREEILTIAAMYVVAQSPDQTIGSLSALTDVAGISSQPVRTLYPEMYPGEIRTHLEALAAATIVSGLIAVHGSCEPAEPIAA